MNIPDKKGKSGTFSEWQRQRAAQPHASPASRCKRRKGVSRAHRQTSMPPYIPQDGNRSELIKQAGDGVHGLPLILRHFFGAVAIKPVGGKM